MNELWVLDNEGDYLRAVVPAENCPESINEPIWIKAEEVNLLGSERYDLSSVGLSLIHI